MDILSLHKKSLSGGVVHTVPKDLEKALRGHSQSSLAWENLTPLARNEWICWVESVKKEETRLQHIERLVADLAKGKRRPCCWYGCIHRTDKTVSPSVRALVIKS